MGHIAGEKKPKEQSGKGANGSHRWQIGRPWKGGERRNPDAVGKRRTFNCRIILVDKVALDQLDGQARFTDTTTADNYQLILSQELVCSAANVSYTEQAKAKIGKKGREQEKLRAQRCSRLGIHTLVAEAIVNSSE